MEPPSSGRVGVINHSGKNVPSTPIKRAAELALASGPTSVAKVFILLTGDDEVQEMNLRFRGVDSATDVLSFPAAELFQQAILGDVGISVPYAERQAALRGVKLATELQYLAIHGVLHLLGWNDEDENDRLAMLAEMNRIGLQVGLPPDPEWSSLLHRGAV